MAESRIFGHTSQMIARALEVSDSPMGQESRKACILPLRFRRNLSTYLGDNT
jgi:hypothetical protein